jgi:hypothetical protein
MKKVMSRLLPVLLLWSIGLSKTSAQYVTIPSPGFVSFLQSNYATCMVGGQLDTNCPAVVNASSLTIDGIPIGDLTGIQYFKNIVSLDCYDDNLTFIPAFPGKLQEIGVDDNPNLTQLPQLPDSLQYLECTLDSLTSLPALPASLTDFNCGGNYLTNLPTLPASLTFLQVDSNLFTTLPNLPAGLQWFQCNNNLLTSLPALPASLTHLDCSYNVLFSLPNMPSGLLSLSCTNCQLSGLPQLPNTLQSLYCSDNNIGALIIPSNLNYLEAVNAQITSVSSFPASMYACYLDSNPLSCLPTLNQITIFGIAATNLQCLPDYGQITSSDVVLTTFPLCDTGFICGAALTLSVTNNISECTPTEISLGTNLIVSGGTPPYTYAWSGGADSIANPTVNPLVSTTYYLTVIDNTGAQGFDSVHVTVYPGFVDAPVISGTDITCNRAVNGVVTITTFPTGGTPPYHYSLNGGVYQSDTTWTNLQIGSYGLIAEDANGCHINSNTVLLTQPAVLVAPEISVTSNVTCNSADNGAITVTTIPTGGIPPYQYSLNGVTYQSNSSFTGLEAGTYSITAQDANGCTVVSNGVTITQPAVFVAPIISVTSNITCNGLANAVITITTIPAGGVPPYQYSLNGGTYQTDTVFTNLAPNTYTLTAKDANNCTIASNSVTITQPPLLVVSLISATNVTCFNAANGAITIMAAGGTSPYHYALNGGVYQSDTTFSGLAPNTYEVSIRDANGCFINSNSVTITQPAALTAPVITVTAQVVCFNGSTGIINVSTAATGGTSPYEYSLNGGTYQSSTHFDSLPANTYTVSVRDTNGCTAAGNSVAVTQPASALVPGSETINNVTCFGAANGSVSWTGATGGNAPYKYSFNGGAFGTLANTSPMSNLAPGIYTLWVQDNDRTGCIVAYPNITITQPAALVAPIISATNVTCFGADNGTIIVTRNPSGGTPPYQYSLDGGSTFPYSIDTVLPDLQPGSFLIEVEDSNGCTVTVGSVTLTQPAVLTAPVITATNALCFDSANATVSVNTTPTGGTPPYAYSLDGVSFQSDTFFGNLPIGIYTITAKDSNGCTISSNSVQVTQPATGVNVSVSTTNASDSVCNGQAVISISGGTVPYNINTLYNGSAVCNSNSCDSLCPGAYVSVITDANGCTVTDSFTIGTPEQMNISFTSANVTCFGQCDGYAVVTPTGGSGTYTYLWNTGSDADSIVNSCAGTYSVTVTDANSNSATGTITITQPAALEIDSSVIQNVICFASFTGSINLTVSGGTIPYQFEWSNGPNGNANPDLNLAAGTYNVTVKDANSCLVSASYTVNQPPALIATITASSNTLQSGQNDTLIVTVLGGVPPYSENWSNGTVGVQNVINSCGGYLVLVRDSNGCSYSDSINISGCSTDSVWPGDANADGIVDNLDLLFIGLGYDSTGYSRADSSIGWYAHYCQNWADTFMGGANYNNADCNGDGIINADDTLAILANFSLTHVRSGNNQSWRSGIPALNITLTPDTLYDSSIVTATITLGDSSIPASNIYGIAFTFNFDKNALDTNSVNLSFSNSWLFGTGEHIAISKALNPEGQLQAAATRINHVTRTGSGSVASVTMKITTGNINGKNYSYYNFRCFITDLTVIDSAGNILPVNEGSDSAIIAFIPTAINSPSANNNIRIYPNPAFDKLAVSSSGLMDEIQVFDLIGNMVADLSSVQSNYTLLDVSKFTAGTYIINVITGKQNHYERVVKVN